MLEDYELEGITKQLLQSHSGALAIFDALFTAVQQQSAIDASAFRMDVTRKLTEYADKLDSDSIQIELVKVAIARANKGAEGI